jgi:hypothetical protein
MFDEKGSCPGREDVALTELGYVTSIPVRKGFVSAAGRCRSVAFDNRDVLPGAAQGDCRAEPGDAGAEDDDTRDVAASLRVRGADPKAANADEPVPMITCANRRGAVEVDPVDRRALLTRSRHPPGFPEMMSTPAGEVVTLDTDHSAFLYA